MLRFKIFSYFNLYLAISILEFFLLIFLYIATYFIVGE